MYIIYQPVEYVKEIAPERHDLQRKIQTIKLFLTIERICGTLFLHRVLQNKTTLL